MKAPCLVQGTGLFCQLVLWGAWVTPWPCAEQLHAAFGSSHACKLSPLPSMPWGLCCYPSSLTPLTGADERQGQAGLPTMRLPEALRQGCATRILHRPPDGPWDFRPWQPPQEGATAQAPADEGAQAPEHVILVIWGWVADDTAQVATVELDSARTLQAPGPSCQPQPGRSWNGVGVGLG